METNVKLAPRWEDVLFHYKFDEGQGSTVYDDRANHYNGVVTYNSASVSWTNTNSYFGYALSMPSNSGIVTTFNSDTFRSWMVTGRWLINGSTYDKNQEGTLWHLPVGRYGTAKDDDGVTLTFNSSKVVLTIRTAGAELYRKELDVVITNSTYHTISAFYKHTGNNILGIYVDTTASTVITDKTGSAELNYQSGEFLIGLPSENSTNFGFDGNIDEIIFTQTVPSNSHKLAYDFHNSKISNGIVKYYETEQTYGRTVGELNLDIWKREAQSNFVNDISSGWQVDVYRGYTNPNEKKIFSGQVETITEQEPLFKLKCYDKFDLTARTEITYSYDRYQDLVEAEELAGGVLTTATAFKQNETFTIIEGANKYTGTIDFVNPREIVLTFTSGTADNLQGQGTIHGDSSGAVLTTPTYVFGKINHIWRDMVVNWAGLQADHNTVQDTGDSVTLETFIANNTKVLERCKVLKETMGWQQYYNPTTNKAYFEPLGNLGTESTILTTGTHIQGIPKWTQDLQPLRDYGNKVKLQGAIQEVITTTSSTLTDNEAEAFNTKFILLPNKPISVKVRDSQTGREYAPGVEGATSTSYDYTVDVENKKIKWNSAGTLVPTPGSQVTVDYIYGQPIPLVAKNQESINTYGLYENTIFKSEYKKQSDAQDFLQNIINKYSTPFNMVEAKFYDPNKSILLVVGKQYQFKDYVNNKPLGTYLLIKTKKRWPSEADDIVLGDEPLRTDDWLRDLSERVHKLQEELSQNTDLLTNIQTISNQFALAPVDTTIYERDSSGRIICGHRHNTLIGHQKNNKIGHGAGKSYSQIYQTTYNISNTGVYTGSSNSRLVIPDGDSDNKKIGKLKILNNIFGINNDRQVDAFIVGISSVAPTLQDTSLNTVIDDFPTIYSAKPPVLDLTDGRITIIGELRRGDGIGSTIAEFGWCDKDGNILNRETIDSAYVITKDSTKEYKFKTRFELVEQ